MPKKYCGPALTDEVPKCTCCAVTRNGRPSASDDSMTSRTPTDLLGVVKGTDADQPWVLPNAPSLPSPYNVGVVASRTCTLAARWMPPPGPLATSGDVTVAPAAGDVMRNRPLSSVAPVTIHALPYFTRCTVVTEIGRWDPASLCMRPSVTSTFLGVDTCRTTWLTDGICRKLVIQNVATALGSPQAGLCPSAACCSQARSSFTVVNGKMARFGNAACATGGAEVCDGVGSGVGVSLGPWVAGGVSIVAVPPSPFTAAYAPTPTMARTAAEPSATVGRSQRSRARREATRCWMRESPSPAGITVSASPCIESRSKASKPSSGS